MFEIKAAVMENNDKQIWNQEWNITKHKVAMYLFKIMSSAQKTSTNKFEMKTKHQQTRTCHVRVSNDVVINEKHLQTNSCRSEV